MRQVKEMPNKSVNSDCQKRRGFRFASATPLLAAGYAWRYTAVKGEISESKSHSIR